MNLAHQCRYSLALRLAHSKSSVLSCRDGSLHIYGTLTVDGSLSPFGTLD